MIIIIKKTFPGCKINLLFEFNKWFSILFNHVNSKDTTSHSKRFILYAMFHTMTATHHWQPYSHDTTENNNLTISLFL